MQETVVIEILKDDKTTVNWICFNKQAEIVQEVLAGEMQALTAITQDRYVIVLLPMSDMVLLNIQLPPMNKQRLAQSLPYAVEEHVLQEISSLHIVPLLIEQQKEGLMPVLITTHAKMQTWMQQLKNVGITPNVMTSTLFSIPYTDPDVTIVADNPLLLRFSQYKGFVCDPDNLAIMLAPVLKEKATKNVTVFVDNASSVNIAPIQDIIIHEKRVSPHLFRLQAQHIIAEKPINLLQGPYFSRKFRIPKGVFFKTLMGLTISLLAAIILYPLISYIILGTTLYQLDNRIAAIYKKQFPTSKAVIAPKMTMEDRLAELTNAGSDQRLMMVLGYLGRGLSDVPSVDIKQLDYTDRDITLLVTASSAEDVSLFVDKLSQQGLQITQQNANLSNDKVTVNLLVRVA